MRALSLSALGRLAVAVPEPVRPRVRLPTAAALSAMA